MNKFMLFLPLTALALVGLGQLGGPTGKSSPTRELMRQKLAHSQAVLEGIATEKFDAVAKEARKLRAVSQQTGWAVYDNPEYVRHTDTFRRNVDALIKSAEERNLDGVTLGYVRVTMNCVECHKFVRGRKTARLENFWSEAND
jgi:hypothetical protein